MRQRQRYSEQDAQHQCVQYGASRPMRHDQFHRQRNDHKRAQRRHGRHNDTERSPPAEKRRSGGRHNHRHHKPLELDLLILEAVAAISEQLGGKFHIVHAYAESARPFAAAGKLKQEHSKAFNNLLAGFNYDENSLHLIDETPIYALEKTSEKLNSDIIVMGAISRSRMSESLIGSTAEKVLDYIKTDVLIIKLPVN